MAPRIKIYQIGTEENQAVSSDKIDQQMHQICVEDDGIGFEKKFAERIFVIFHRLYNRHKYPGTGIGLALCRKIVDRHGGTISAKGAPDEGSVFTIRLPMKRDLGEQTS